MVRTDGRRLLVQVMETDCTTGEVRLRGEHQDRVEVEVRTVVKSPLPDVGAGKGFADQLPAGLVQTDLQAGYLAEPAVELGFFDAATQVGDDLHQARTCTKVHAQAGATDTGMFVLTRRAVGASTFTEFELARVEVSLHQARGRAGLIGSVTQGATGLSHDRLWRTFGGGVAGPRRSRGLGLS